MDRAGERLNSPRRRFTANGFSSGATCIRFVTQYEKFWAFQIRSKALAE